MSLLFMYLIQMIQNFQVNSENDSEINTILERIPTPFHTPHATHQTYAHQNLYVNPRRISFEEQLLLHVYDPSKHLQKTTLRSKSHKPGTLRILQISPLILSGVIPNQRKAVRVCPS